MTVISEQTRPPQQPALELFQDERHYVGVELRENNPKYRDKNKPWRLSIFNNAYGTFEVSCDLSRDEAEAARDWLNHLLDRLPA